MHKFYDRLIGVYKINTTHRKEWGLFQKGIISMPFGLNWLIAIFILVLIAAFIFPTIQTYLFKISWVLSLLIFLKFGEYKGYNECLHDLEDNN